MKWKDAAYNASLKHWTPPKILYPCSPREQEALHALKNVFDPLPIYPSMESSAEEQNTFASIDVPLLDGQIAFLENTVEKCTSPQTKHSQEGMQGAKHWVQRVDTPAGMFRRLTDGYGVSLMFGERHCQYIRNRNNWRGSSGVMLDIDVFYQQPDTLMKKLEDEKRDADLIAKRLDENEKLPLPVYSQSELFDHYPLLKRICSYLIPSASSLYDGRPFKARGIVLFPTPVTDQRIYRAFGDILCRELDCIPANVTKNPVAVGFGNTHNATDAFDNNTVDTEWITDALETAEANKLAETKEKNREKKKKAERKACYAVQGNGAGSGENISAFIEQCNPVSEMVSEGMLIPGNNNQYQWHGSENDRSCEILSDSVIHIYSHSMQSASPAADLEPVNAHRFYLYQLTGLDLTKDADKARCRQYLFENGYGSDPKVFLAKSRHKQIKLHKTDAQLTLETLQRSREFIANVFESSAKVFGLRADTGVGKNEAAIQYVYEGIKLLLNLPHKNLMDELVFRFDKAEIPPFAYRGIMSNPDGEFPYESPCIQPARYDGYARKGGNPRDVICSRCDMRGRCEDAGHWYDLRQMHKYQVNLFTFPQLFTNPIFRGWIQSNIGTLEKDDLILHDDTEITDLFNVIEIKREHLESLSRQHEDTNTGSFADMFLSLLHKDDLYKNLKRFIAGLTDTERDEIIGGLSHVRIDGELITLDDAVERGYFRIDTLSDLDALPRVQDSEWTLIHQLELFFDIYPYAENAPIHYGEGVLSFAIAPILPKTKARIGFMGATLQEEHLHRAFPKTYYPNVMFYDATSTEWHTGARVYQLATNRNPRRTVLTDGKLNATGESYWQKVMDIVSRLDGTHAIITYKSVIDEKQQDIEKHGLITAHFGALTGLDERFKDIDYLHILFSPERPPRAHQWNTKMIYGSDADTVSFDRNDDGSFIDKRVQSVYDAGVIAELIQAFGRARVVNYGIKVFLWCSHELPTITHRDQTFLFTERDTETWTDDNTETLEKIVVERQQKTPVEITEEEGISTRQAYNRTVEQRKIDKKKRNAEIVRLSLEGHSNVTIALHITKEFGKVSEGTVRNVIKANS